MTLGILSADSLWHFRHDVGAFGQLIQILTGLAVWSLLIFVPLKLVLLAYEVGKGQKQNRKIEREADNDLFRTPMGWYRTAFCLRLSVSSAFIVESLRFNGGWPSLVLLCLGGACWYALSPERQWMR